MSSSLAELRVGTTTKSRLVRLSPPSKTLSSMPSSSRKYSMISSFMSGLAMAVRHSTGGMFLSGCYSVENGEWHHRDNEEDVPMPMGNPLEEARQRAMTVKAQLREDLDIGVWFVPVVVFTDIAPDDDVIDETRAARCGCCGAWMT